MDMGYWTTRCNGQKVLESHSIVADKMNNQNESTKKLTPCDERESDE